MSELAKRLERAERAIAKHKPDLALAEYMEALRDDPQNDKVREAAADLCVTMNRPAEAASLLDLRIEDDPEPGVLQRLDAAV